MALFAGFVPVNSDISLAVPSGTGRSIQIFLYLPPLGTSTCPTVGSSSDAGKLDFTNVYLVGQQNGIDTTSNREVTVDAAFPGMSNNVTTQQGLAVTCPGVGFTAVNLASVTANKWGVAAVPLALAEARPNAVSVDYQTIDGSALQGTHYVARSGTLSIPAGQTSALIYVPVLSTNQYDGPTTFQVRLSNPNGTF